MHRFTRFAAALGLALLLSVPHLGHSQEATITEILNACYDSVNEVLRAARWAGVPGAGLTPTQIFNAVYIPAAGASEAYLRMMDVIRGETPPVPCVPSVELFTSLLTGAHCICNTAGDGWLCGAGGGTIITELCNLGDVSCVVTPEVGWVLTMGEAGIASYAPPTGSGSTTLAALTDVDVTTPPTDGQALIFDDADDHWKPGALPAGTIAGLTDVDVTTPPTDEQVLTWEASTEKWTPKVVPGGAVPLALDDLTDVVLGTPMDGHALIYDAAQTRWESTAIPGLPPVISGEGLRLEPIAETTTCDMTRSIHKLSPTGTTTCTLPAATDTTKPSFYQFFVMNTNGVSVAPTGANLLNGLNTAMATVTGPFASITCHNLDDTNNWQCAVTSLAGYGANYTTLCAGVGGGTNNSATGSGSYIAHSLECVIPAGKLTVGSLLEICGGFQWSTGTGPPAFAIQWRAGATALNNSPGNGPTPLASLTRQAEFCMTTVVGEAPGASTDTYNMFKGILAAASVEVPIYGNGGVTQPVVLDTTGALTLTQASRWSAAGTGTNTLTQQYMTVKGSGLLP